MLVRRQRGRTNIYLSLIKCLDTRCKKDVGKVHSRHEIYNQCWVNVGLRSETAGQQITCFVFADEQAVTLSGKKNSKVQLSGTGVKNVAPL